MTELSLLSHELNGQIHVSPSPVPPVQDAVETPLLVVLTAFVTLGSLEIPSPSALVRNTSNW